MWIKVQLKTRTRIEKCLRMYNLIYVVFRLQMSEESDVELIPDEMDETAQEEADERVKETEAVEEKELDEEEEDEEQDHYEVDDGDDFEFYMSDALDRPEAPLSAVPPRVVQQDEGQMEVSTSPAFQCIDDVRIITLSSLLYPCDDFSIANTWGKFHSGYTSTTPSGDE